MIRIVYGWYNVKNPLFGILNRVDMGGVEKNFRPICLNEIKRISTTANYDLYIHKQNQFLKDIFNFIEKNPELKESVELYYDNGNKFWLIEWTDKNIKNVIKQCKTDEKLGLI